MKTKTPCVCPAFGTKLCGNTAFPAVQGIFKATLQKEPSHHTGDSSFLTLLSTGHSEKPQKTACRRTTLPGRPVF
ncbi:MAG TPA: hypothetical protein DEV98_05820 [Clostridiales bacterium]|nr:hypothetical protein [Clostridiales bacterium]